MSRVNYSKWDNIELSDDEDIEVHPNVDKKSFVKWRQQQIHIERDERRAKIDIFSKQIPFVCNHIQKLKDLHLSLSLADLSTTMSTLNSVAAELDANAEKLRLPAEVTQFFGKLARLVAENGGAAGDQAKVLIGNELNQHITKLQSDIQLLEVEVKKLKLEESKKLASDTLCKPGFDNTRINKSTHVSTAPPSNDTTKKNVETQIEVLNPEGVKRATVARNAEVAQSPSIEELDQFISNHITKTFAMIPGKEYQRSFKCIGDNPWLVNNTYSDEIMAAAFQAQFHKKEQLSRNLVHQAQVLQFCSNLGKDGIGMFFARIQDTSHKATVLFHEEVKRNYNHIATRCKVLLDKAANNRRTGINLTPSGADDDRKMKLFRDIPEPVKQALLTENMETVQKAIDKHVKSEFDRTKLWKEMREVGIIEDASQENEEEDDDQQTTTTTKVSNLTEEERLAKFKQLPEGFGDALMSGDIEKVNQALATLSPEEAENTIAICKEAGFMDIEEEGEEEMTVTENQEKTNNANTL